MRLLARWLLHELPWLVLGGTISAVTVLAAIGENASDVYLALAIAGAACPIAVILPSPVRDAGVFLSTGVAASGGALISVHLGLISERPGDTQQGMMSVLLIVLTAAFLATGFGKLRGAEEVRRASEALDQKLDAMARQQAALLQVIHDGKSPSASTLGFRHRAVRRKANRARTARSLQA